VIPRRDSIIIIIRVIILCRRQSGLSASICKPFYDHDLSETKYLDHGLMSNQQARPPSVRIAGVSG